jgi:glycosyltransferase involved in cell wall biosynthesis
VISSNSGGLPEVNFEGVSGYLSDVGNIEEMANYAIKILEDEVVLSQFKENALSSCSKVRYIKKYFTFICRVV